MLNVPRFRNIILIWALLSIVLGLLSSRVPWGDSEGFHGVGLPVASVYWDYSGERGGPVDYPNPYAPVLNILAFFVVGAGLLWVVCRAAFLYRFGKR